jgi:uncharacterized protein (TIGR02284 family)
MNQMLNLLNKHKSRFLYSCLILFVISHVKVSDIEKGEHNMDTGNYQTNPNLRNDLNPEVRNNIKNSAESVEKLNELIRGERSAVDTYLQALEKVGDDPRASDLKPMVTDHEQAIRLLSDKVQACGGKPSSDSGAWGTWAETVMGTAKIFGDRAALSALKQGEEHGVKQYEEALENNELDASARSMIQNQLLPQQKAHIQTIDQIIATL